MANQVVKKPFPVPCELLSIEIGELERDILEAAPRDRPGLEKSLASLQSLYQKECVTHSGRGTPSLRLTMGPSGTFAIRQVDERAGVKVIFGGTDGILVTLDPQGHVHIRGPEGPGGPEERQAVAAIVQGLRTLTGAAAAAA